MKGASPHLLRVSSVTCAWAVPDTQSSRTVQESAKRREQQRVPTSDDALSTATDGAPDFLRRVIVSLSSPSSSRREQAFPKGFFG